MSNQVIKIVMKWAMYKLTNKRAWYIDWVIWQDSLKNGKRILLWACNIHNVVRKKFMINDAYCWMTDTFIMLTHNTHMCRYLLLSYLHLLGGLPHNLQLFSFDASIVWSTAPTFVMPSTGREPLVCTSIDLLGVAHMFNNNNNNNIFGKHVVVGVGNVHALHAWRLDCIASP